MERVNAQVATWRGRRLKLRYRGTVKNNAWLKRRTAAMILQNWPAWDWPATAAPGSWPPDQRQAGPGSGKPARRHRPPK